MVPIEDDWDSQDEEAVDLVLNDDEATRAMRLRGGSSKGKKANIERGHESGHFNLIRDYFSPVPIYSDEQFARRFCMPRDLFLRIVERVAQRDPYFQQRRNVTGKLGLSTLQKCTAAIRILSTGSAADTIDDYVRIGESTSLKCLKRFALALIDEFGDEYLRDPTKEDIEYYMEINEVVDFQACLVLSIAPILNGKTARPLGEASFKGNLAKLQ
ncbi:hypothetical protein LEN26_002400 [Aphanomyces euteiches]|nr:hypothetical protein LEN26_002400 [Aphanomyces euteiches]